MDEKLYRIAVLILLVTLAMQAPLQRWECEQTRKDVALVTMITDYKADVYDNPSVDNINQQLFIQGEYQFIAQVRMGLLIAACAR